MKTNPSLPLVYLSQIRTLFLGTEPFPIRELVSAASQLLVCLDGEIIVYPKGKDNESFTTKSIHIDAGTRVRIDTRNAVLGVCFLDVIQRDPVYMKHMMKNASNGIYYGHDFESDIVDLLCDIRTHRPSYSEAQERVQNLLIPDELKRRYLVNIDPRLVHVTNRIKETIGENIAVKKLAEEVNISESRLVKLFKEQIGIPIRKYRLWIRIHTSVIFMAAGASLTESAMAAGFSNAAHFSRNYSAMLGISPSFAFPSAPVLDIVLPEEYLQMLNTTPYKYHSLQ